MIAINKFIIINGIITVMSMKIHQRKDENSEVSWLSKSPNIIFHKSKNSENTLVMK